jgi:hypothetical protein
MTPYPDPIDPSRLDLVMREHDHAIFYGREVLKTPEGNDVAGQDQRLLKHLLAKMTVYGRIDLQNVNSFALFCMQRDHIETGRDGIMDDFGRIFNNDLPVQLILGKKNSLLDAGKALACLDKHPAILNLLFWGMPETGRRMRLFTDELTGKTEDAPPATDALYHTSMEYYRQLTDAEKAAANLLLAVHTSGFLLPLMLLAGNITPSEYATATLAIRLGHALPGTAGEDKAVARLNPRPDETDRDDPVKAYGELHLQAIRALEYVSFFTGPANNHEPGIRDLIRLGESYNLEFKTSLRWDVRQQKKNPAIEHASLKTITAFLNSGGGHLLIGVEDSGQVAGIETDRFENDDKFLLHFWNLVKSAMGQEITPYIRTTLEKTGGLTVCHVRCMRSPAPVFLRQKGLPEEFYIRTGPGSSSLGIGEAHRYISEHFPGR